MCKNRKRKKFRIIKHEIERDKRQILRQET